MKTNRPVIRCMGDSVYHVDLRAKRFDGVRSALADGKRVLQYRLRREAEAKADEIAALLTRHGKHRLETFDLILKQDPIALQAKLAPFGKTIPDAVDFHAAYLAEQREKDESQTVGVLLGRWLEAKAREVKEGTLRPRTIQKLREMAAKFRAKWGEVRVAKLTSSEIEAWLNGLTYPQPVYLQQVSQQTKYHHWSYLSQFLAWSRRKHGAPKENPCAAITIKRAERDPEFYTPDHSRRIMDLTLTPQFINLLPFHAICLFSGVRSNECQRLTWESIDFDDQTIVIQKAEAKSRKHRRVEMRQNLVEWLRWFREHYAKKPLISGPYQPMVSMGPTPNRLL